MVMISVADPPALLAVTVYERRAAVAVGVPEIAPVAGLIERPAGSAGEIVTVTGAPVITGVRVVIT
jgi:hypothetical protein